MRVNENIFAPLFLGSEMDNDDERLKQAPARFFAESSTYDRRFGGLEETIVNGFLKKLKQRKGYQNEILQAFADEVKNGLRDFQNMRTDYTVRLAHIGQQWLLLGAKALRLLIAHFVIPGQESPIKPGIGPLQTLTALADELAKNRQRAAGTHADLEQILLPESQ
jgi:capsid protein